MKHPNAHARAFRSVQHALTDATAPWAVVAVIALALILSACAVDQEKLQRSREDLEKLCQGAITTPLKEACKRAGIDTEPSPEVE